MDLPPPKADFSAPPPYELATSPNNNIQQTVPEETPHNTNEERRQDELHSPAAQQQELHQHVVNMVAEPEVGMMSPTSKLPTYEEVQMEKTLLGEMPMDLTGNTFPMHGRIPPPSHPVLISALRQAHANGGAPPGTTMAMGPNGTLTFIAIESADGHGRSHSRGVAGGHVTGSATTSVDNSLLGTDFMFLAAFIVAFLFNWIGFLMLTCFFHTIAARYGALSGFGLSLAKWTLIVKKSTDLASHENSWLWWLIMAFGCLICVRALVQYVSIKRTWRMMSAAAQERLLFFY